MRIPEPETDSLLSAGHAREGIGSRRCDMLRRSGRFRCGTAGMPVVLLVLFMFLCGKCFGQAINEVRPQRRPLAEKQEIVRDRMTQLEDRIYRLIEKLSSSDPKQAQRLETALRQTQESLIRRNMDETITLLENDHLAEALDLQLAIVQDLERALELLLENPDEAAERQKDIEQLKAIREKVLELRQAQQALKTQTEDLAHTGKERENAERQNLLRQQAEELAARMRPARSGSQSEHAIRPPASQADNGEAPDESDRGDGSGENSSGTFGNGPAPGADQVGRAGQHMGRAAERFGKRDAAGAGQQQQQAIEQLDEALEELEQTLDQLRREQREEILRGLEARFRSMLDRQLTVNEKTRSLDDRGASAWTHSEELTLAGLCQEERNLAEEAGDALRILIDEGTTIAFPQVVRQLQTDLTVSADRLNNKATGPQTQALQDNIADTLTDLVNAVKQIQSDLQSGQGGGGASGPQRGKTPPLLPASAELKLLRSAQIRVNRQTSALQQPRNNAETDAGRQQRIKQLSQQQEDLSDMARKMHERITGE